MLKLLNTVKIKIQKEGRTLDEFVDSMDYCELLRGLPLVLCCSDDLEIVAEVTEKNNSFIITAAV